MKFAPISINNLTREVETLAKKSSTYEKGYEVQRLEGKVKIDLSAVIFDQENCYTDISDIKGWRDDLIPAKGNTWNQATMTAFGSESERLSFDEIDLLDDAEPVNDTSVPEIIVSRILADIDSKFFS